MKISVDGGGLCADTRFGNYTFSESLMSALQKYDHDNHYDIYTFCRDEKLRNTQFMNLRPQLGWMKLRVSLQELVQPHDIFLAMNQSLPLYSSGEIIVFSHGLSFKRFPHYYVSDIERLNTQLRDYLVKARYIIVSSKKVYQDFVELYPRIIEKVIVLPFGIPLGFEKHRESERKPYFLFCGMNHQVKNVNFLVKIFRKFTLNKKYSHYQLHLVGPFSELEDKNIRVFETLSRDEKRNMYAEATGYLTASHYESFNLPVLEALSQKCPVVGTQSAIIPEMEKYCAVVADEKTFVEQMVRVAEGHGVDIDVNALTADFSWKQYIYKLQELYKKA